MRLRKTITSWSLSSTSAPGGWWTRACSSMPSFVKLQLRTTTQPRLLSAKTLFRRWTSAWNSLMTRLRRFRYWSKSWPEPLRWTKTARLCWRLWTVFNGNYVDECNNNRNVTAWCIITRFFFLMNRCIITRYRNVLSVCLTIDYVCSWY